MTAIYRMGARVASNPSPSQGYWKHGQGPSKPVMPSYGGFGGYGVSLLAQGSTLSALEDELAVAENFIDSLYDEFDIYYAKCEALKATAQGSTQYLSDCIKADELGADIDEMDEYIDDLIGRINELDDASGSGTTTGSGLSSSLPGALSAVSGSQVKNKAGFDSFVGKVKNAYKIETGKDLSYSKSTPSDALGIAPLFGELSTAAKAGSKTVGAITKAAGWFYCNTEKDALKAAGETSKYNAAVKYCSGGGSTTSSGSKGGSKPPAGSSVGGAVKGGKPFYKQTWFFVSMGVLGAAVVFGVPVGLMVKKKKRKSQF